MTEPIEAWKDLIPIQQTMEFARAQKRGVSGKLAVCAGVGIYSVDKAFRCSEWQWQAPQRTKDVIMAEDEYLQERKAFEKHFEQARRTCLLEP